MARTNLKTVSVYVTEEQADILARAAARETRSLSNYLLALGLEKAEELGVTIKGAAKKRAAGAH